MMKGSHYETFPQTPVCRTSPCTRFTCTVTSPQIFPQDKMPSFTHTQKKTQGYKTVVQFKRHLTTSL